MTILAQNQEGIKFQFAELYAEIPETLPTEEDFDRMETQAIERGIIEPEEADDKPIPEEPYRFNQANGQVIVVLNNVQETAIGRITSKFCEVEMTYRFSHSEYPKVEAGVMKGSIQYWGTQEEAADDLYARYRARRVPRMIQLADGLWCNANVSDEGLGFLNWVADRNNGGY